MNNKKNSIKYILEKRNMRSKDIVLKYTDGKDKYDSKYVSKVVNGYLKINPELVAHWEKKLRVPKEYFFDEESGRRREMNSSEIIELDSFLNRQMYLEDYDELPDCEQITIEIRKHTLENNIVKLQRKIRKDILDVEADSIDNELNGAEGNLIFYNKILDLRKQKPITRDELDSLFKAFAYLIDNVSEDKMKEDANYLAYGLCSVIRICREVGEKKRKKAIENFIKLFGEIVYEDIDE